MYEDARSASYAGPTETPLTLSPDDRKCIVKLYSGSKPAAGKIILLAVYTDVVKTWHGWARVGHNEHVYSYRPQMNTCSNVKLGRRSA